MLMRSRIAYIILFMTAFIFPSIAQDSYVEYEYVDGTKETDIISFDRMEPQEAFPAHTLFPGGQESETAVRGPNAFLWRRRFQTGR